jgi:chaperonin GroEL (HSP60 family)
VIQFVLSKWFVDFKSLSCFYTIESVVLAGMTIANIVRTSLGSLGLDKMLVNDIGVNEIQF